MALRRGYALGTCASCETFYLMAKLCGQEGQDLLSPEEMADVASWITAGSITNPGEGCDQACPVIRLYSRMSRTET
jgi:hypothetical protein